MDVVEVWDGVVFAGVGEVMADGEAGGDALHEGDVALGFGVEGLSEQDVEGGGIFVLVARKLVFRLRLPELQGDSGADDVGEVGIEGVVDAAELAQALGGVVDAVQGVEDAAL